MKKYRFYILGAVLVAAVATFAYQNNESTKKSNIAIDNIEALADSEGGEITPDCSTDFNGALCGTVEIGGVPFSVYYPQTM